MGARDDHSITVTVSDAPPVVRYIKALNAEIVRLVALLDEKDYEIKNLRKFAPSHPHDIGQPAIGLEPPGYIRPVYDDRDDDIGDELADREER